MNQPKNLKENQISNAPIISKETQIANKPQNLK
jgi:hypothetical protein